MKKSEIAKHCFARHPQLNELHITSDGQAFSLKHQADAHTSRLKDKEVESFKRHPEAEEEDTEDAEQAAAAAQAKEAAIEKFPFLGENVKKASAEIGKIGTAEELDAVIEAEKAVGARKGVTDAVEARKAELEAAAKQSDSEEGSDEGDQTGTGTGSEKKEPTEAAE